jgi:hypothetical protein
MSDALDLRLRLRRHADTLPRILLSNAAIEDDADIGDPVGTFSASNGGTLAALELTDDAGGKYALDGNDLEVADTLTAGTDTITVAGTIDGVAVARIFAIVVAAAGYSPSLDFSDARNSQYLPLSL